METLSIEARARQRVTPALVSDWRRDGAVCVRQLLSPDEVALLREGIDANLAAPSPRAKVASRPGDPGFFIEDFCNWQDNPAYRRVIFESPLAAAAGLLTGSESIRLYHDHMLTKEPATRAPTPWHQDQPYYNIEGTQNCSMWIAVDPVRRHSTLEFVAGSHLGPWLMPRTLHGPSGQVVPRRQPGGVARRRGAARFGRGRARILGWDIEPGDVVCFHMLALHAAGGVDGDRRRRVFSLRFIGDDIRHAPRRWITSPAFPGLADELPAGAPMHHPLFPLLWEKR